MVVDTPGLRNPRHSAQERGAGWSELCHNYLQERLLEHCHTHTFTHTLERYAQVSASSRGGEEGGWWLRFRPVRSTFGPQERIPVELENPENSPAEVVSAIDQPPPQVATATRPDASEHRQAAPLLRMWRRLSSASVCLALISSKCFLSLSNLPAVR